MIIDAHVHFSNVQSFYTAADEADVDYSYAGYLKECKEANVKASVCMGVTESTPHAFPDKESQNPMLANLDENTPPGLFICMGVNPHTLDEDAIKRMKARIKDDARIKGFKIYAGYYHRYITDDVYTPVYKLAAEHGLPVAIHTGDTYSETGLLEYSHPLAADKLAVQFRDVNFLLCHMGNPWVTDACEIAYKNRNVYLDISGLEEGNERKLAITRENDYFMNFKATGLHILNNWEKVLFGTDWPLVPVKAYADLCRRLIPQEHHDNVFFKNARNFYQI